jgi:apolipoprotein N-acyltransferase
MSRFDAAVIVCAGWIGLSLLQSVFAAFSVVLLALAARRSAAASRPVMLPFVAASLFTVFEWLQTFTWAGVPWGRLSLGQTEMTLMLKSASVFGSYFITFLIVAVNFSIAMLIFMYREKSISRMCLSLSVSLIALNLLVGTVATAFDEKDGEKFKAAAVQVNMSSHDKWNSDSFEKTKELMEQYTILASNEGAKLIVFPETVFPYNPLKNSQIYNFMTRLAVKCNVTMVVGGFTEGEELDQNSLIFVYPDGSVSDTVYSKRHLVPFGEYVPMRKVITALIPQLSQISMLSEDLEPGTDGAIVDSAQGKLGGLVCFDSIYERLLRDSAKEGAEIIVLGTNDSWFLDSAAVYMHNSQSKLRAVEIGRYIVRSANTGVSSVIDPNGIVLDSEPPLVEGYAIAEIAARSRLTVYTLIGDVVIYAMLVFFIGLFLLPKLPEKIKIVKRK